jgi:hypothetical protein
MQRSRGSQSFNMDICTFISCAQPVSSAALYSTVSVSAACTPPFPAYTWLVARNAICLAG